MKGEAIKRGKAAKGNRLAKAKKRLADRIAGYEAVPIDKKKGMTKPGSLKVSR